MSLPVRLARRAEVRSGILFTGGSTRPREAGQCLPSCCGYGCIGGSARAAVRLFMFNSL